MTPQRAQITHPRPPQGRPPADRTRVEADKTTLVGVVHSATRSYRPRMWQLITPGSGHDPLSRWPIAVPRLGDQASRSTDRPPRHPSDYHPEPDTIPRRPPMINTIFPALTSLKHLK